MAKVGHDIRQCALCSCRDRHGAIDAGVGLRAGRAENQVCCGVGLAGIQQDEVSAPPSSAWSETSGKAYNATGIVVP